MLTLLDAGHGILDAMHMHFLLTVVISMYT